jgi:predicted permease
LALRSLQTLSNVHLGFQPQNLLLASFDLGLQRYSTDQGRQFHARLLEQVRALPGVRDASLAENVPFEVGGSLSAGVTAEGRPPDADADLIVGRVVADHAFLKTTGLPVIEGRDFTSRDDAAAPRVAIVNQVLALRLWPNGSALGGRLVFQGDHLEVVGVVGEARYYSLTDASRPLVFRPLAQNYRGKVTLTVRTMADPIHMVSSVQHIVRGLDPDLPLHDVRTMKQQLARSPLALQAPRIGVLVAGTQGTIALFLATLGIFGLVSFDVTRRTHEIGVRVALGARAADVVRLISTQSVRLTLVGLAFGLLLTVGLTRPLAPLLYGVKPTDAVVLGSTVVVILAASLLACYLPARRAARADPMTALRCE